ncbi:MAG TPA: WD40 repeat domain-containing protein, partial [Anaerolineales bacterium]|nr:WD40 repeat domain-containing protein [Anaerolineales bacterium]
FLRLTRLDESADGRDTRRRVVLHDLIPADSDPDATKLLIKQLADARLVVVTGNEVEVAHEALIRYWERLRRWLNDDRDNLRLREDVTDDAHQWESANRDESLLNHRGPRLELALAMSMNPRYRLNPVEQAYLDGCIKLRESEIKAKGILRRRTMTVLATGLIIALLLAAFAAYQMTQAQHQTQIALARQLAAEAQTLFSAGNSKQQTAVLLAIQSMRLFPNGNAVQILQNNTLPRTMVQLTHDAAVSSVAFSPDGKYIVSGGLDGTVRVWDVVTGKETARMMHDHVTLVAFSPDGKFVASAGGNIARVWNVATGKEVAHMIHDHSVNSFAFSPDGKLIVSGGCEADNNDYCIQGSARVWDAMTGKEIEKISYDGDVTFVAFSPDGKFGVTISGSYNNAVYIWEVATGKEIAQMKPGEIGYSVAFSPDGKFIVSGGCDYKEYGICFGGSTRVFDASTGTEVARMIHDGAPVGSVAFSPDGKFIVSGGCDNYENDNCTQGSVSVWDATTYTEITRVVHDGEVTSVVFSPDGKFIASVSGNTAHVWAVSIGKETARMEHNGGVSSMALSLDGRYVVSGGCEVVNPSLFCLRGFAHVWDVHTGEEMALVQMTTAAGFGSDVYSVAFSPDGKFVASGGLDSVLVWNAVTGNEITRVTHNGQIFSVAFSPDAKYVVSGSLDGMVRVWDAMTGKEIEKIAHGETVHSVAFSPDGKYVVSGGCNELDDNFNCIQGSARVWDAMTGKEMEKISYDGDVTFVAFSPDGKLIVSVSGSTALVWDVITGKQVVHMFHGNKVSSVAFSPDGRFVVSGSADRTIHVWDVITGKEITGVTQDSGVRAVAYSPDGKFIASVSGNTAHVWDAMTGKEMASMIVNGYAALFIAFSSDGKYLISGGCDQYETYNCTKGSVRVWIWQPNDLIAESCSRVSRNLNHAEWAQYIGDVLPYRAVCPNLPIQSERIVTPSP